MSKQQSQEYRGNGEHSWEEVGSTTGKASVISTQRLRVPGGWLYRTTLIAMACNTDLVMTSTFVPMPKVVKHEV